MKRKIGAVAAFVVLVVAVMALPAVAAPELPSAATGLSAPAFPPRRPTRVLVLGDSVMAGAASQYGPALPGRDVTVDAMVNRSTGQGAAVVAQRGADWDVVVVLLGHNDGGSPGVYQPAANRILDQLGGVPRVVWLSLHEVRPYYRDVNAFLRTQAVRRPNLRIADWNAVASAHPEGLASDGLHLNGRGASLMAGLVADQVQIGEREVASSDAAYREASRLAIDQATLLRAKATHDAAQTEPLETIAHDDANAKLLEAIAADQAREQAKAEAKAAEQNRVAEQETAKARVAEGSTTESERTPIRSESRVSEEVSGPNETATRTRPDRSPSSSAGTGWMPILGLIGVGILVVTVVLVRQRPRRAR